VRTRFVDVPTMVKPCSMDKKSLKVTTVTCAHAKQLDRSPVRAKPVAAHIMVKNCPMDKKFLRVTIATCVPARTAGKSSVKTKCVDVPTMDKL